MSEHPCQRCGSEEWSDVDYSGCSDCREESEPCTCTIACTPQGITEDQFCRLTEGQ